MFFTFFFKIQKTRLFAFFEVSFQKNVKNIESVIQVFTLLHSEIANWRNITHMSCYTYNIILELFIFRLKYNGFGTVRRTTKLIEGRHRGLQANRPICYYFYVFTFFSKSKKSLLLTFFLPCLVRFLELCSEPTLTAGTLLQPLYTP